MKITNKYNLPDDIAKAIRGEIKEAKKNRYSITSLIKPTTIAILERRYFNEIEVDVTDLFWSFIGRAIHSELEKFGNKEENEIKIETSIDGIDVVGKIDLLKDDTIVDYKVVSVWSYIFDQKRKDKPEWYQQLNCYNFLAATKGIEAKKIKIVCIFRDWQKKDALKNSDYPSLPLKTIEYQPAPLKDVEKFILERINLLKNNETVSDDNLPICSKEERWQKSDVYAVRRTNQNKALRLFANEKDAVEFCDQMKKQYNNNYDIDFRKGEDVRCLNYCTVKKWCPYGKSLKKGGEENEA